MGDLTYENLGGVFALDPEPSSKFILPKGYLSASAIKTFLRCPSQYMFRYVDGLIEPPKAEALVGSLGHAGLEAWYGEVIANGTRLPAKAALDAAEAKLPVLAEQYTMEVSAADKDALLAQLPDVITPYITRVAHRVNPSAVEEEVTAYTSKGVKLLGYVDLLREMDEEEICLFNASGVVLCDYKFTGKKWSLGQLKNNLQFMLYRYMTGVQQQEIHNMRKGGAGKITKDCSDDFLAEEQDITSNLRILRTSFDADNTEYVEHVVHSVATAITSGVFTPCDPEAWCCNETWCGYWNRCRGKMTGWDGRT